MVKKKNKSLFDLALNDREGKIAELELEARNLTADIEDAVDAYVKAGGEKKLKAKRKGSIKSLYGLS